MQVGGLVRGRRLLVVHYALDDAVDRVQEVGVLAHGQHSVDLGVQQVVAEETQEHRSETDPRGTLFTSGRPSASTREKPQGPLNASRSRPSHCADVLTRNQTAYAFRQTSSLESLYCLRCLFFLLSSNQITWEAAFRLLGNRRRNLCWKMSFSRFEQNKAAAC